MARATELVENAEGLSIDQIDTGSLVMELMRISGDNGLRLPPELSMLGKALLNLDQVAHTLDPAFEPMEAIELKAHAIDEAELMRGFQKLANRLTMGMLSPPSSSVRPC